MIRLKNLLTENGQVILHQGDKYTPGGGKTGQAANREWGYIPTRTGSATNLRDWINLTIMLKDQSHHLGYGFEIKDVVFTPNEGGWIKQEPLEQQQPIKCGPKSKKDETQILPTRHSYGVNPVRTEEGDLYTLDVRLTITNLQKAVDYLTKDAAYGTLSFTITPRTDLPEPVNQTSRKTVQRKVSIYGSSYNNVLLPNTRTGSVSRGGGTVTP